MFIHLPSPPPSPLPALFTHLSSVYLLVLHYPSHNASLMYMPFTPYQILTPSTSNLSPFQVTVSTCYLWQMTYVCYHIWPNTFHVSGHPEDTPGHPLVTMRQTQQPFHAYRNKTRQMHGIVVRAWVSVTYMSSDWWWQEWSTRWVEVNEMGLEAWIGVQCTCVNAYLHNVMYLCVCYIKLPRQQGDIWSG